MFDRGMIYYLIAVPLSKMAFSHYLKVKVAQISVRDILPGFTT